MFVCSLIVFLMRFVVLKNAAIINQTSSHRGMFIQWMSLQFLLVVSLSQDLMPRLRVHAGIHYLEAWIPMAMYRSRYAVFLQLLSLDACS